MRALATFSLLLILSFSAQNAKAQKSVTHQQLIWYAYFLTVPIDKNWSVVAEIQERHFVHQFAQHQLSFRTHIHRKLGASGWEASAGFGTFFQSPNKPTSDIDLVVPELRPHAEFAYKQTFQKFTFDHRFRGEARYFHHLNIEKTELEDGYYFGSFRFRYRILASYPIWKTNENLVLKVIAGDEMMIQAGKKVHYTFDQNRMILGIGLVVSSSLNVEATYQKWINQRETGGYYNRDILRLTMNHRIEF